MRYFQRNFVNLVYLFLFYLVTDKFDVRNLWQQTGENCLYQRQELKNLKSIFADIHKGMTQGFQYVVDGMDIQIFKLSPTS